jgi:hypothetical protein
MNPGVTVRLGSEWQHDGAWRLGLAAPGALPSPRSAANTNSNLMALSKLTLSWLENAYGMTRRPK